MSTTKNPYGIAARLAAVCGVAAIPITLFAKPPIKLFEASEEDDAVQMTISSGDEKASEQGGVVAAKDARRIEPKVRNSGSSMFIEAKVQGREVLFLVDTGASYTTLTPWFAKLIGASPPSGAPVASFQTAGGTQVMPFGVMPSLEFAGQVHRHVTFSTCASCGDRDSSSRKRPVVGLLGMNVLGRYKMDVDGDKLGLIESTRYKNRRLDIDPWVTLEAFEPGDREGEVWPIEVTLENKSERDIKGIVVSVSCQLASEELRWEIDLGRMSAGKKKRASISSAVSPRGCMPSGMRVLDASW